MAFGDISPDAVLAAIQIPAEMRGIAIAGDSSGGWHRIRAPHTSLRQAVNLCNRHADRTPDLPELAPFRPVLSGTTAASVPLAKRSPAAA
jgi:S-DNA-T family DNA segregation ATPase FtsK/SpoIIIE